VESLRGTKIDVPELPAVPDCYSHHLHLDVARDDMFGLLTTPWNDTIACMSVVTCMHGVTMIPLWLAVYANSIVLVLQVQSK
jgi:hypothetical protein